MRKINRVKYLNFYLSHPSFPVIWMLRDLVLGEICAQHLHYPAVVWTTVETHLIYVPQDSDEFIRATSDEGTHSISSHLQLIARESSFFELTNLQNQLISSYEFLKNSYRIHVADTAPRKFAGIDFDHHVEPSREKVKICREETLISATYQDSMSSLRAYSLLMCADVAA